MFNPVQVGKQTRYSYARIKEVMEMPHLLDIQRNSYEWFKKEGLQEIFQDISPISDFTGNLELFFESFTFGESKYSLDECKKRDGTYAAPVRVKVKLRNKAKGEVKEQEVFMGDFPIMTETGTFIINGAERVIVSQLVRSPGAYYDKTIDQTGRNVFSAQIIPNRGAWIELETDSNFNISVRIDRTRKMPISYLLRALDFVSNEQILQLFDLNFFIKSKLSENATANQLIAFLNSNSQDHADPRNSILLQQLDAHSEISDSDFLQILNLFSNLDSKFDSLSNCKYFLDLLFLIDEKNPLTAAYKAFVDALDLDKKNNEDNKERALVNLYSRLRPGEPPSAENALSLLNSLFFDPRRYDLAQVGRFKLSQKLAWKYCLIGKTLAADFIHPESGQIIFPNGTFLTKALLDSLPDNLFTSSCSFKIRSNFGSFSLLCSPFSLSRTLAISDILSAINFLWAIIAQVETKDDIDHLGNRRVRAVGELLQNQFRIGMARMERVVRERMTTQDADIVTPQNLINIRPVVAAIKEFFGSSQLSQFMDQHNPLSELTHKRRLSALGPGGLSRERAGFEVRDVHISHYGRMCPIETPEGPNIGLIGSLSNFAKVNSFGFIETPYRIVDSSFVTNHVLFLSALEEEPLIIAQANEPLKADNSFLHQSVTARSHQQTSKFPKNAVQLMDVSPKQVVSIASALIPFLEHDDANRALMGANMQRQAVPLLKTQAPLVGTGMEAKAAADSGVLAIAKKNGFVSYVDANTIRLRYEDSSSEAFFLHKFRRSNQGTCINQRPIVSLGERVFNGLPIADGPATSNGELALGYNIIVAYMPWEGYNYEDAILLNENLIKFDIFSSIHIEEFQCDARDTKLGPEEVTRDIPNISEDSLALLDSDGIISIGSDVQTGDILVGKVTPKGETELSAEERLLRAIFGEKAREVRDSSLRVPHGEAGKVVAINIFTRENNDEMQPGVNKQVRVYIAQKRKISVGDKMSGRHGNKGVVSEIRRQEDMPFLPDGTPVDIVLNPLGVPSRMNIGQILEAHLGMAVHKFGNRISALFHFVDFPALLLTQYLRYTKSALLAYHKLFKANKISLRSYQRQNLFIKDICADLLPLKDSLANLNSQLKVKFIIDFQALDFALKLTLKLFDKYSALKTELFNLPKNLSNLLASLSAIENSLIDISKNAQPELLEIKRLLRQFGFDVDAFGLPKPALAGLNIASPVFDGASVLDIQNTISLAGLNPDAKTILYDGRTGQPFQNPVTVGCVYMLKLHHLVDDKIHARSTGPYSLVTQQPLGGKAQFGGQRFGEMEVWALEAYGAAFSLQEILTVKSDDVLGRVKAYEAIVKGQNIPEPGVPESFKVLIKELQSIALDIRVLSNDSKDISIADDDDDDDSSIRKKADLLDVDVGSFGQHQPTLLPSSSL